MKTNQLFLLVVLSFYTLTSFAQIEKFDLGKYINPYYKRQQLNFNFNMNGTKNTQDYSNNNYLNSSSYAQFSSLLSTSYNKVLNSVKLQQYIGINLGENFSIDENTSKHTDYQNAPYKYQTKSNYKRNYLNFYVNNSNLFYFEKRTFFQLNLNLSYSNQYNKINSEQSYWTTDTTLYRSDTKYNSSNIFGRLGFRFGKGRIEYIQDARLALYILDDLQKHGRLTRTLTDEEIIEFSKTITQVKNKRFFDTRIRKIEEITKIDSFLNAGNLISKSDAAYFTTLTDNWDNASGPERMAGLRYSVGLNPEYYRSIYHSPYSENSNPETKTDSNTYGLSIDGQADYHKPLNLYWQLTSGLNAKYRLLKGISKRNDEPNSHLDLHEFSSEMSVKLGFYPSSRTSWEASFGLTYKNVTSNLTSNNILAPNHDGSYNLVEPTFSLYGNYYISQRLRLQASYQLSDIISHEKNEFDYFGNDYYPRGKQFNNYFNISLNYMLF